MKKLLLLFSLLFSMTSLFANDGVFYVYGNQLIPINENEISITKEILNIRRAIEQDRDGFPENYAYITVDYTFFNAGKSKSILVGFEAPSPSGDIDSGKPVDGKHPFIYDFTVRLNDKNLTYKTALVKYQTRKYKIQPSDYIKNGKVVGQSEKELITENFNDNDPNFYYVNYFDANFKEGKNTIRHTYKVKMSRSVVQKYTLNYILTAATRWANQQIDDFTLNIDMGEDERFEIDKSFFNSANEWKIENGRTQNLEKSSRFITLKGGITFKKKNFRPKRELSIYKYESYYRGSYEVFNVEENHDLPKKIKLPHGNNRSTTKYAPIRCANERSHKILRNLPYALRGYVFKTDYIQNYYLTQEWYRPNPEYESSIKDLSEVEKTWLSRVKLKD